MKHDILTEEIRTLLERNDQPRLMRLIEHLHPVALARLCATLRMRETRDLLGFMKPERRARVFSELDRDIQLGLLEFIEPAVAAEIIAAMPHDDRVDLVKALPMGRAEGLLKLIGSADRSDIARLGAYAEGTAGAVMTSDFASLHAEMTVEEAIRTLRTSAERSETVYYVYVLDDRRRLVGIVTLRDLLLAADPTVRISALMRPEVVTCRAGDDQQQVARLLKEYDLIALPVINGGEEMVGIVTFDDVIDLIEEETSETMYSKAGVAEVGKNRDHIYSERLTNGSIWYPIRVRLLFLMVTLAGGLLVGGIIDAFEETLAAVLAAAVFIPLIMDMGGNVGTQSTTIFARGYALGHINLAQMHRHILREGSVGIMMGLILGTVGGAAALFWQGIPNDMPQLGFAVGVSLFTVTTLATMLGFALPWVMLKIGVDHAPGADPFVTTIKDFVGLALYFTLVSVLIGVPDEEDVEAAVAVAQSALSAVQ